MMNFRVAFKKGLAKPLFCETKVNEGLLIQTAGIKDYPDIKPIDKSDWPEYRKLRAIDKQPLFVNVKPPRMYKSIKLMRGPEQVHTDLLYGGYGIKALLGGRLRFEHFEFIRLRVNKSLDTERMFALWRVESPWQPVAKRGTGKRLGGGKGAIHHYVTPVKAQRVIIEIGGDLHKLEARAILRPVSESLPFPNRIYSQEEINEERRQLEKINNENINPYDMPYIIRNNMGGCKNWLRKHDQEWFGWYK